MQLHGRNLPTLRLSDNVVDLQNAKGKEKAKGRITKIRQTDRKDPDPHPQNMLPFKKTTRF
jgi:hypothetical protein